jgi:hypothetical protein
MVAVHMLRKRFNRFLALLTHVAFASSWENARLIGGDSVISNIRKKEKSKEINLRSWNEKKKKCRLVFLH